MTQEHHASTLGCMKKNVSAVVCWAVWATLCCLSRLRLHFINTTVPDTKQSKGTYGLFWYLGKENVQ